MFASLPGSCSQALLSDSLPHRYLPFVVKDMPPDPKVVWQLFGDNLGELKTTVSLYDVPLTWINANENHIWNAVDDVPSLSRHEIAPLQLLYPVSDSVSNVFSK